MLEFAAAGSVLDPKLGAHTPHQLLFLELSGPRLSKAEASLVSGVEWSGLSGVSAVAW